MKERYDIFTSLITNINRTIQKIKSVEMEKLGLKGKQVQIIFHLYNKIDGLSITKLSMFCDEDKAAVSRVVKELEGQGYVFVENGGKQKYRNPIKLTESGKEIGKYVVEQIEQLLEMAGEGIQENDRKILYDNLSKINLNLQAILRYY